MGEDEFVIGEQPRPKSFEEGASSMEDNLRDRNLNRDLKPKSGWKSLLEKFKHGTGRATAVAAITVAGGAGIHAADQQTGGHFENSVIATANAAQTAAEGVATGADHTRNAVLEAMNGTRTAVETVHNAGDATVNAVETGVETVHNAGDATVNAVETGVENVYDAGVATKDAVIGTGEAIAETPANIRDGIGEAKDSVVDAVSPEDSGEGVDVKFGEKATLIHITNDQGEDKSPAFRSKANMFAHEYTSEELKAKGIDVSNPSVRIRKEKGGTYPSQLNAGFIHDDKTDTNYGVWAEILDKNGNPTGVYFALNFMKEAYNAETQTPPEIQNQ